MKNLLRGAILGVAAASFLLPGCSGNVNDDSVSVINIRLMSLSSGGQAGISSSRDAAISADGNFVAFTSFSSNLDPRDTNTIGDVFVRNVSAGTTSLVSVSSSGASSGDDSSERPAISPDGRFVAFASRSSNLVAGMTDPNGTNDDVFVRDLVNNVTVIASCTSGSSTTTGNSFSSGFDRLAIALDAASIPQAVYVAFISSSTNLVAGGTTGFSQLFLRRIPLNAAGALDNTIGLTVLVSSIGPATAGNGASNQYPGIGQNAANVFLAWTCFAVNQVTVAPVDASPTADIVWRPVSKATFGVGTAVLVSVNNLGTGPGGAASDNPSLSADGNFVAWDSGAVNLDPSGGDSNGATKDVFRRGPMTGLAVTSIVSRTTANLQAAQDCINPSISATGALVAFESASPALVPGDSGGQADIFIRQVTGATTGVTTRMSFTVIGGEPNAPCQRPAISGDGQFVAFESSASNIIGASVTFSAQIYRRGP